MTDATTTTSESAVDMDALREKYRIERDKRLRAEGTRQYIETSGEFARYMEDPYAEPIERDPVFTDVEVAVIGGGFGGLLTAGRLRAAGVESLRIIEKGGDFGGTWYWNRYPGIACDTEAYIYLPLLEETGYIPTQKYAKGSEIYEHSRRIARQFDLYRDVLFQTQVTELRWDGAESLWTLSTDHGDSFRAKYVCMANGVFNRPKLPGIPGIEKFKGHSFHTSRWDYEYTGGDSNGGLVGLADKKVGIIGTGATAVQCIPHLGASAEHLYVFQRTPSSVDVRANRPTDPEWAATLKPGWQRERMENFSTLTTGGYAEVDLVADGWTDIIGKLARRRNDDGTPVRGSLELADFEKMEQVRKRAEEIVADPDVAESLKPYYRQFCKRPCFHDEYLQTYNRGNVTLVDTQGRGVESITETGVIANGVEYELDCLIYASGYEVGAPIERRAGYPVYGRNGLALADKWREGVSTLFGMQTRDFPNCFLIGGSQTGTSANFAHGLDIQTRHIAHVLGHARAIGAKEVDVAAQAEADWVQAVLDGALSNIRFLESCTPGYLNAEGQPNGPLLQRNGAYGPGIMKFTVLLDEWRAAGTFEGLEFTPA